jgi:hypothetical protein
MGVRLSEGIKVSDLGKEPINELKFNDKDLSRLKAFFD